jgi:vancomycin resistance protein YoaR
MKEEPAHKEKKEPAGEKARINAAIVWTLVAAGIAVVVIGLGAFAIYGYERLYANRIFPGVRVLGVRMDGLTEDEARIALHTSIDNALKDGIRFTYADHEITLGSGAVAQNDPDLSRDFITYDVDNAVVAAMSYGRSGNVVRDALARWIARAKPVKLDASTAIDEKSLESAVAKVIGDHVPPAQNARIAITWDEGTKEARVNIEEAKPGKQIVWEKAMSALNAQAATLRFSPIALQDAQTQPKLFAKQIEPLKADAESLVNRAPITLVYAPSTPGASVRTFTVSKERFAGWVNAIEKDGRLVATIDPAAFAKGVRDVAPIEVQAQKGTFNVTDGKITDFSAGSIGVAIDDAATLNGILAGIQTTSTFPLVANAVDASLDGADPQQLGIKEIIGIGTSNFSGSPANRRKNIATGVAKVNGTIVAPGEEFSMLKTIGEITPEQGWLPELVIKGNKTTPELGGGLCQIGTTMFRAALNAGMKITERRNHSYRVTYYEPAGTDATIYDPAPDMKWVNDTGHSILIHAFITGNIVTYEFWGTKDGRKVTVGPSKVTGTTPAPPKKIIETLDLKPGQTKCSETAHAGADAELPYHIEYADGTTHDETFYSHYRPWQAVCLVGVEKLSDASGSASSTTQ